MFSGKKLPKVESRNSIQKTDHEVNLPEIMDTSRSHVNRGMRESKTPRVEMKDREAEKIF